MRELDEFAGTLKVPSFTSRIGDGAGGCEQLGFAALHGPGDIGGRTLMQRERARGFAPAVEIGFAVEGDVLHQKPKSQLRCLAA